MAYTVYFTYLLESTSAPSNGNGYNNAIHCNYINSVQISSLTNREVNINFDDPNDFKFFKSSGNAVGITVNKIYVLVQLINNSSLNTTLKSDEWRKYDVTNQITGYVSGQILSGVHLSSTVFKVPIYQYNNLSIMSKYVLNYLNYPTVTYSNDTSTTKPLCFGDEEIFLGNVSTNIESIAYTVDLAINLPTNEFNSSTNETWDNGKVYISEIALYDENYNMVAIGKMNNPIAKDSSTSRNIIFAIDF